MSIFLVVLHGELLSQNARLHSCPGLPILSQSAKGSIHPEDTPLIHGDKLPTPYPTIQQYDIATVLSITHYVCR